MPRTQSRRFSIRREQSGKPEPRWVLRWSGHVLMESYSRHDVTAALSHYEKDPVYR
jgi:hypothetical protein